MVKGGGLLEYGSKKNELVAELTYWYHIDVGSLPKERQLGLLANLPRVQAQGQIFEGQVDPMDEDAVYDLYMAAYGDPVLARAERLKAVRAIVRTSCEAARVAR